MSFITLLIITLKDIHIYIRKNIKKKLVRKSMKRLFSFSKFNFAFEFIKVVKTIITDNLYTNINIKSTGKYGKYRNSI